MLPGHSALFAVSDAVASQLIGHYLPNGTDLSVHSQRELNERARITTVRSILIIHFMPLPVCCVLLIS
jgi:hypothetical protein